MKYNYRTPIFDITLYKFNDLYNVNTKQTYNRFHNKLNAL